jgi:hypothetical protein
MNVIKMHSAPTTLEATAANVNLDSMGMGNPAVT